MQKSLLQLSLYWQVWCRSRCGTFSLVTQFVVVLPQFGDQLSSLQLDLRVGGQVVSGRALSDDSVGLDVQIPVDPGNKTDFIFPFHQQTR